MAFSRTLLHDLHHAAHQFRRTPAYAAFVVLVLALGIGTVTAMCTVLYAVLLKPLPFAAGGHLYQPLENTPQGPDQLSLPLPEIRAWQDATRSTADIAFTRGGLNIADGPAGALLITEVEASPDLFALLGARPALGRAFLPGETGDHADGVLLSDALWRQAFGADPAVLGQTVHIGGNAHTVIGVMPPGFLYPLWEDRPQAWVPADLAALAASAHDTYTYLSPVVRLHPGVPLAAVAAQLTRIHTQLNPKSQTAIHLSGVRELLVADARPALLALAVAVSLVWLIACANVAGLLLARVMARRTEIAVRAALGAARRRIVSQFLAEGLLLACAGGAAGLALAAALLAAFRHLLTGKLPLASSIRIDWPVILALVALTLLTALVFATAPALLAARTEINANLKTGSRTQSGDRGSARARTALLIGQVALSVALLIGAGLMMRTMYALRHTPLGFRTDHLVTAGLTVPNDLYRDRNLGPAVWQPLLDEIRLLPGVRTAALATVLPIQHPVELMSLIYKTEWMQDDDGAVARAATPGLPDALGVRLRAGRFFTEQDTAASLPVMVVNQTFVNRFLGGGNPLGKVIHYGHTRSTATVIGVLEDIRQDSVAEPSQPEFYLPSPNSAPASRSTAPSSAASCRSPSAPTCPPPRSSPLCAAPSTPPIPTSLSAPASP